MNPDGPSEYESNGGTGDELEPVRGWKQTKIHRIGWIDKPGVKHQEVAIDVLERHEDNEDYERQGTRNAERLERGAKEGESDDDASQLKKNQRN